MGWGDGNHGTKMNLTEVNVFQHVLNSTVEMIEELVDSKLEQ